MRGTLILTVLTVTSSYLREIEEPLNNHSAISDTVQWWISEAGCWRIRTFAVDHDIHTYFFGDTNVDMTDLALANTENHYGDVINSQHVIEFNSVLDNDEVKERFQEIGLEPRIEIASGKFVFWKPDDAEYRTQSEPK